MILFDPKIFNLLILVLFAASMIRWLIERDWPQAAYAAGALILNIAVLFMTIGKT